MQTVSPLGWISVSCGVLLLIVLACAAQTPGEGEVRDIGSRLELFVDDYLIESMNGVTRELHSPERKGPVMILDRPWEGAGCHYFTLFQDGEIYRMYYRGNPVRGTSYADWQAGAEVTCYAESRDGIHWTRPDLNLFEGDDYIDRYGNPYSITKPNNIVWHGQGPLLHSTHNFSPFKDANPACKPEARYKAVGRTFEWASYVYGEAGLLGFQSPDGIHWSLVQEDPIIISPGLDGHNVVFWDSYRGRYVEFERGGFRNGYRDMATRTSPDFINWTPGPMELQWFDWGGAPPEHIYTSPTLAYSRAPHIFLGLATRLVVGRVWVEEHPEHEISDGIFVSSRDGLHFDRSFMEAWIRPGLDPNKESWIHCNTGPAWGLLQTGPEELSVYWVDHYGQLDSITQLQRGTLRIDGFVSMHAKYAGGEFITKPLTFTGSELVMNFSTSAVGSVRVEIQDSDGNPIPGFTLADCPEIYGDAIEELVKWKSGSDVSALAGQVVRLRFVMKDADLYALRFRTVISRYQVGYHQGGSQVMHTISPSGWVTVFCGVALLGVVSCTAQTLGEGEVRDIGSRLELFVDEYLIESMNGVTRDLHSPERKGPVMIFDRPWEGTAYFFTVFQNGDLYRMYYRGNPIEFTTYADWEAGAEVTCYAESRDGIHWTRPDLNIFAGDFVADRYGNPFTITKPNNIVWIGQGEQVHSSSNFVPFKDTNPACQPEARYKAIGRWLMWPRPMADDPDPPQPDATGYPWPPGCGLVAFQSPDGIHWSLMQEERIIKKTETDSQNVAFWDPVRGCYVCYTRVFGKDGAFLRSIATLTSDDFLHWSDPPEWLDYGGAPDEHMYTCCILPYFRAPHINLGLINRLVGGRVWVQEHPEHEISDAVFMSSRDGVNFDRSFMEAWIRPGLDPNKESWIHCNTAPAWGILQTGPEELSVYWVDHYQLAYISQLQRGTLRLDGFVSVHAPYAGGEFTTKPLIFAGRELVMNFSTSAVGSVRVEIQDQVGNPLPGFALGDCPEIYGDAIEEPVKWKGGADVSALAGQAVRLRFVMKDADLYSIRFRP